MRLLILSQYYPPETGAPQNRLSILAQQLTKKGNEVHVFTAMPNYPEMKVPPAYKGKLFKKKSMDGIKVYRSWIYVSTSRSVFSRLLNYFSFVFSSLIASFFIRGKYDFVFCESPPLFLGITGWLISKFKRAKFIFNVSDLWPESAERLGIIKNKSLLKSATRLEEFLYKKSFLITGQTQGIVSNIRSRFPKKKVEWLPNGVDVEKFETMKFTLLRMEYGLAPDDFVLLYAGIIGHAQGLEIILNAAKRVSGETKIKFLIVGDGPEKEKLVKQKTDGGIDNVYFLPSMKRADVLNLVHSCNASIIPLRKLELFKGAIPSKIFENLILSKPLLLGVDGEARELFIEKGEAGIYFEPENAEELAKAILALKNSPELCSRLGNNGRQFVIKNFSQSEIASSFLKHLQS